MLFTWFTLTGLIFLFAPQNLTSKFQLAFVHVFRWPLSVGGNLALTAQTQQPAQGQAANPVTPSAFGLLMAQMLGQNKPRRRTAA